MISRKIAQTALASALVFTMCTAAMCEMGSDDSDNKGDGESGGGSGDGTGSTNQGGSGNAPSGNGGSGNDGSAGGNDSECTELVPHVKWSECQFLNPSNSQYVLYDCETTMSFGNSKPDSLEIVLRKGMYGTFEVGVGSGANDPIASGGSQHQQMVFLNVDCEKVDYVDECEKMYLPESGAITVMPSEIPTFHNVRLREFNENSNSFVANSECYGLELR